MVVTYPLAAIAVTYPLRQLHLPKGKAMAFGTNAPNGLQPYKKLDGSAWTGQTSAYPIASGFGTAIFKGDLVALTATGTIAPATPGGGQLLGVFWGVQYTDAAGNIVNSPNWVAGSTTRGAVPATAFIIDDPKVIFSIQETDASGNAGTPIALADVFLNANVRFGTGNPITGTSAMSLNNATEATTATLDLKILGLDPYPGNAVGSFANWLVMINNHAFAAGTAGI